MPLGRGELSEESLSATEVERLSEKPNEGSAEAEARP